MRKVWFTALTVPLLLLACGGEDRRSTIAALGLLTFELPGGWSVVVPTQLDDDPLPVLSVGTDPGDREDGIGVYFYAGSRWPTMRDAETEWSARAEKPLEFEPVARSQGTHVRAYADGTTPDGYPIPAQVVEILSRPETSSEPWVVVICAGGPGKLDHARAACDRVLETLEVWDPAIGAAR